MKRLFLMVAMFFVTSMAVGQTTLEAKVMELAKLTYNAMKAGDEAKVMRAEAATMAYYTSLSSTNKAKFEQILVVALAELEAIDAVGSAKVAVVKAKATDTANMLVAAFNANNTAKAEQYGVEAEKYLKTLSEKEVVLFTTIVEKIGAEAGLK